MRQIDIETNLNIKIHVTHITGRGRQKLSVSPKKIDAHTYKTFGSASILRQWSI